MRQDTAVKDTCEAYKSSLSLREVGERDMKSHNLTILTNETFITQHAIGVLYSCIKYV